MIHIFTGDFLPPEELKKFMEIYKSKQTNREPDLSDYKEYKLKENNKGNILIKFYFISRSKMVFYSLQVFKCYKNLDGMKVRAWAPMVMESLIRLISEFSIFIL